jgi:hypothetical protein
MFAVDYAEHVLASWCTSFEHEPVDLTLRQIEGA